MNTIHLILGLLLASPADPSLAWKQWESGDVHAAHRTTGKLLEGEDDRSEAVHVRVLSSFCLGRYEECLALVESLDQGYARRQELTHLALDAYRHMERFEEAAAFAKAESMASHIVEWLEKRAARPLEVTLDETIVVPFAEDNFIDGYMPAIPVEIAGKRYLGHLDTGGTYVAMSPGMARDLGIDTISSGIGFANDRTTKVARGLLEEMKVGKARLTNVPVVALDALTGVAQGQKIEDMIILGTNFLQRFLTTWDNREGRLVLSPRNDPASRVDHEKLHPENPNELDFFLYSDHYLFANGAFGDRPVVFFVDTGLVAVDSKGRQASLGVTAADLRGWGLEGKLQPGKFVGPEQPISLGHVVRPDGALMVFGPRHRRVWHGMPVEALLSFGFLKHYVWTLDFDRRKWLLSPFEAEPEGEPRTADSDELERYPGQYEVAPGVRLVVSREESALLLQAPGQQPVPLTPDADGSFSIKLAGARVEFVTDELGAVKELVLKQGSHETRAKRVE